jgi:hypothetical protein
MFPERHCRLLSTLLSARREFTKGAWWQVAKALQRVKAVRRFYATRRAARRGSKLKGAALQRCKAACVLGQTARLLVGRSVAYSQGSVVCWLLAAFVTLAGKGSLSKVLDINHVRMHLFKERVYIAKIPKYLHPIHRI